MTYDIPACTIPGCPREDQLCRHERRAALLAAPPFEAWVEAMVDLVVVEGLLELEGDHGPG
jgi:hypothetical protein